MAVSNKTYSDLVSRCAALEMLLHRAVQTAEPYTAKCVTVESENGPMQDIVNVYPEWVSQAKKLLDEE